MTNTGEMTGTWDYSALPKNIRVGENCYLEYKGSFHHFRSVCDPGLVLGSRVRVYTWTQFAVEPEGKVVVGSDSVLVGAAFWCAKSITIGERVLVSYNVMIVDSDFHPLDPDLRRRDTLALSPEGDKSQRPALLAKPVIIEDDAQIGIGAMILKGVRVGAGARVDAGSVVTSDVPARTVVAGNPARITGWEAGR
jgi:acetyltransferase-like isoleucine patch superfamily enzyme